jgi:hypothetical protein
MDASPLSLLTEAERVLLVLMARGDRNLFGEVRRTSAGKRWRIDARPYGWIHGLAGVSFGDARGRGGRTGHCRA